MNFLKNQGTVFSSLINNLVFFSFETITPPWPALWGISQKNA